MSPSQTERSLEAKNARNRLVWGLVIAAAIILIIFILVLLPNSTQPDDPITDSPVPHYDRIPTERTEPGIEPEGGGGPQSREH